MATTSFQMDKDFLKLIRPLFFSELKAHISYIYIFIICFSELETELFACSDEPA